MAVKKGVRKNREQYIKRDIRELQKYGVPIDDILQGKEIKSIAYNKTGYENYRRHIRRIKSNLRKDNSRVNQHGRLFTNKELKQIRELEEYFNEIKLNEYKRYASTRNNNIGAIEKAFLFGKEVRSRTGGESLKLSNNFAREDIFNSIGKKDNLQEVLEIYEEDADSFYYSDVVDNGKWFDEIYLRKYEESGKISEIEREILLQSYQELEMTQKSQIKKTIDKKMQAVESATKHNPKYSGNTFMAINDIILVNISERFILN